jgi:glycosyltransferase involved in cell wall biosynthesis
MKLLYLTFQEEAPLYVGVTRKIASQAHAFEKLGYEVTYTLWKDSEFRFFTGGKEEGMPVAQGSGRMHRFAQTAEDYLKEHSFDVLYVRLDRIRFDAVRLCRLAKSRGTKQVILEIPNYPYLKDYLRNIKDNRSPVAWAKGFVRIMGTAAQDRLSGLNLRGTADAAVLIGDRADSFFGVKAVNITNGVDVSSFRSIRHQDHPGEIVLAGVAGTLWWQAYDRVLAGMAIYKKKNSPQSPRIRFILVGGDAKEMPEFREQIRQFGLENEVECPGFLTGEPLFRIYEKADLGVSSLGCYRRGLTNCSSLKAREYCAAGIPFLYAYEDDDLSEDVPFAMKIPNNPAPVEMDRVVEFIGSCWGNPGMVDLERQFAGQHYDWESILKRVLDFAGAENSFNFRR